MNNIVDRESLIKYIETEIKENRFNVESLIILLKNGAFSTMNSTNKTKSN